MDALRFESVQPDSSEAQALIGELDADLARLNPGIEIAAGLDMEKFRSAKGQFFLVWQSGEAVACGALIPLDDRSMEIKRVYVRSAHRGRSISRKLLAHLLEQARQHGTLTVRLGTGKGQIEALTLYRSAGFVEIPHFGSYIGDDNAICMEKRLAG